jgi:hypothetical protein
MNNITEPLRLAIGSHSAGTGKGCAMNVISWENGDTTISDLPACSDELLSRIVQRVNDTICDHRTNDLLCPACSVAVLELGHRTVGTGDLPLTRAERMKVWVLVACDQAREVLPLTAEHRAVALAAIEAAEGWVAGTVSVKDLNAAANAYAYAADAAYDAAYAAAYAAANAANADAANANAYANAANANANAYANAADAAARLRLAHKAIDKFAELTGHIERVPDAQSVECAVAAMLNPVG